MADTVTLLAVFGYWTSVLAASVLTVAAAGGGALVALTGRRTIRRHQAELARLRQSWERRAEQVAALSHELRTPLSMIKAAADLLLEESPDPLSHVQHKFLRVISQQGGQVIGLCEGLLIRLRRQPAGGLR